MLIVGRGGGSIEELWAFNEETVVRAIADSALPVISAVGHETDFTLADFAADVRAATPSQAAEIAVPDRLELERRLQQGQVRLRQAINNDLLRRRQRLSQLIKSPVFTKPERLLAPQRQALDNLQERLIRAAARQTDEKKRQWLLVSQKLALLNPLGMLQRGYAFLSQEDTGEPIRSVEQVTVDSYLEARVQDGALRLHVMEIKRGDI